MSGAKLPKLPFFVYGTLRHGQPNHALWGDGIARTAPATLPGAALFDCGPFPMLALRQGRTVHGELVWTRADAYTAVLNRLDKLEGFNPGDPDRSLFKRRQCSAQDGTQQTHAAWVYLVSETAVSQLPEIPGGDWSGHMQALQERLAAWRGKAAGGGFAPPNNGAVNSP